MLILKGFGTYGLKIRAPRMSEIQPRRIQPPILVGVSDICYFFLLGEGEGGGKAPGAQGVVNFLLKIPGGGGGEAQGGCLRRIVELGGGGGG